jgi:diacylglycerol kinase (ATP)
MVESQRPIGSPYRLRFLDANRTIGRVPDAPVIIVNPTAGSGRAAKLLPWIRERLAARPDADLFVTSRPGAAQERATRASADGCDRIVAVGGDGTTQEIVNGILAANAPTELGIVPVGSGNDLARSLGLPLDPAEAWTVAIGRVTRRIDAALATNGEGRSRWFASAGGIGFDAQVAAAMSTRRGWQSGRAGYLLTTLSELRRFDNRRLHVVLDGEELERRALLVAIANGPYYGGGMRIAPDATLDDGWLDLCIVGDVSRLTAIRELPNLYRGTHVRNPAVSIHRARRVEVSGEGRTHAHLDGEPFGTLPLNVEVRPGCLEVAATDRPSTSATG